MYTLYVMYVKRTIWDQLQQIFVSFLISSPPPPPPHAQIANCTVHVADLVVTIEFFVRFFFLFTI